MCLVALAADEVPEGYTPVYTAEDLNNIRNDLDGKYILMNDIDLSEYEKWESVGKESEPFKGELDGRGHKIVNMTSENGVFGCLNSASIKNLGVCDCDISRYIINKYAGVIADKSVSTKFENCYTIGSIFGTTGNGPITLAYDFCPGGIVGFS